MNEWMLFVFMFVVNDNVFSLDNAVHPTTFLSYEDCIATTEGESKTHIYRYLTEEQNGSIIGIRFECAERIINYG
jgi:hypothetical protein